MSRRCPMTTPSEDWDPLDPAHRGDPTRIHAQLRESCPVAWSDQFDGFYAVSRFEDVSAAAIDFGTFSSAGKITIPDITGPDRPPRAPVEIDPPLHTAYRDLLNRFFEPEYIRRIEPVIRRTARDLIGRCVSLGETDAVASFTFHMPIQVQCIFLGISVEDAETIKTTVNRIIEAGVSGDRAAHKEGNDQIYAYIYGIVRARRKTPHDPNDLISAMLNEPVDGRMLSDDDVAGTLRLFLQAGHGTTTNALGSIVRHLATHSEDTKRLRESPRLIPQAIEEILRVWTPVRMVGRRTTHDVVVAGRVIPEGSRVALMVSSANRDAAEFDHADEVDIDRRPNRHIAFGFGPHRCVGASLARAELRIAVEELLSMTDDFVMTGDVEWSSWSHLGPSTLPMRFIGRSERQPSARAPGMRELELTVAAIHQVAERTAEIVLAGEGNTTLPEWAAGAHIDLVLPGEIVRSYSLIGGLWTDDSWRIAVLHEVNGRGGSAALHNNVSVGSRLRVRHPRNNFELKPAVGYHFLASGIGITPILGMIESAKAQGIPWQLDYVGRRREQMAYLDRLESDPRVRIHITSNTGRPDLRELLAGSAAEVAVYACGSQGFLLGLEEATAAVERDLHVEWFAPRPGARKGSEGAHEAFAVHLARANVDVTVQPGQSIVDACADAGVTIPTACFEGTCGSCLTHVIDGIPDHRDSFLSPKERASNNLMAACVSKSKTDRLVLDW